MSATFRRRLIAGLLPAVSLLAASSGFAESRDQIKIVGSSTVFPFSTTVAEHFGKGGKFKSPVVESTGTGGGFKIFCGGTGVDTPDINDASRPITDGEKAQCAQNGVTAIDEFKVGFDGIILASGSKDAVFNVTLDQLWRATAKTVPVGGKLVDNPYKHWNDIDPKLPKLPILLFGPAPNHGTRDAFVELVMDPSCRKAPEVAVLGKDEQKKVCAIVREDGAWTDVSEDYGLVMGKLAANPKAMAVFTFSYLDQNRNKIHAATVGGVTASLGTIASGQYPISRPLFIYVKRAHVQDIPGLSEFVTEYLSDRSAGADGYLADKGLIPLPKAELAKQRAIIATMKAHH
jgi:phosphate transport system substrate-binding protein